MAVMGPMPAGQAQADAHEGPERAGHDQVDPGRCGGLETLYERTVHDRILRRKGRLVILGEAWASGPDGVIGLVVRLSGGRGAPR